jgi:hypothetical protein
LNSFASGWFVVVPQGPSIIEGLKEPTTLILPLSNATPSVGGRVTVEILEVVEEESVEMGMELLWSALWFGPDPIPEPALFGARAIEGSSTPSAGASDPVVGASRSIAIKVVVDPTL